MEFVIGDLIWIYPHDELSWCPGQVVKVEQDSYLVTCSDNSDDSVYRVNKSDALPVHPSCLNKLNDLLSLGEFNEGALLHTIRERYLESQIYTSVGTPILISLNPYCKLQIYSSKTADLYRKSCKDQNPHLFLMAEKAYSALRDGNQSIIISGESGAGKTEAAKIILSYLAGSSSDNKTNLAKQVLDSNPILEAFGNAKTLRNDNSSRFGKFIEIHFDSVNLKLQSARIQNYLLEKSRIVGQQVGERNYHFFYQICKGASEEEREKFSIGDVEDFFYLNQSECFDIEGVDDQGNYKETRECMKVLGFSELEQEQILSVVMGVLHLGNIKFTGQENASIDTPDSLSTSSKLLGIEADSLCKVLTTRVIIDPTNNQEIIMPLNTSQAIYTRDATSKAIYSKLFNWLVNRINKTIFIPQKKPGKIIGLLDIYGFEVFETNSFEQFCINYANEKLQQHFNHHMFKSEQAEYSKEKIKWDHISYDDNQDCIDLIEKSPLGIISLMDEQCKLQKGTDKQFLYNVSSKLVGNHKLCNPGQFASEYFGISHYAGNVFYNVSGFLEKNKDSLNPQLALALGNSALDLVRTLFDVAKTVKGKQAATPGSISALSLAAQFKSQLHELIKAISGSTPTYIRCIKPNSEKLARVIDSKDVQRQLRCAGMLECIRIRKAGYSVRRSIKEFVEKYSVIVPGFSRKEKNWSLLVKNLMDELRKIKKLKVILDLDKKLIQVGLSMVFMKDEVRQALDSEYAKKAAKFAVRIQKVVRMWLCRRKFHKIKKAVRVIQRQAKDWIWRLRAKRRLKKMKSLMMAFYCKIKVYNKKKANEVLKKFLQVASSKAYLSYFRPTTKSLKLAAGTISTEKMYFSPDSPSSPTSPSSKSSIKTFSKCPKDLTQGQSSVIDTFQRELKTLSYLLQREKEKNKLIQEESNYYKDLYSATQQKLELIEQQEIEKSSNLQLKPNDSLEKYKKEAKNLKKQIKDKETETSMLSLKIESLKHNMIELEETNKELKAKQGVWEQKLYAEMRKNAVELQELRNKLANGEGEKTKTEKITLEKEIRSLKASLRQSENENSLLKSELTESEVKLKDFHETESCLKDQIKSLQSQLSGYSSNMTSLKEGSSTILSKKLQEMVKEQEKMQDELEDLYEEKENLQVEVQKLKLSEDHFKQELSKSQKANKEKAIKIRDLENEVEELHHEKLELTRAKIELQTLKQKPGKESESYQELKAQINELNQEVDDLIKELTAAKQIHSTLLTLVKIKNNELEVIKQSGDHGLMADLENQEKGLLEE